MCVSALSVVLTCGEDDSVEIDTIRMGDEELGAMYVRLHHKLARHTCRPSVRPLTRWGTSPWRVKRSGTNLTRKLIEAKAQGARHLPELNGALRQPAPPSDREPVNVA